MAVDDDKMCPEYLAFRPEVREAVNFYVQGFLERQGKLGDTKELVHVTNFVSRDPEELNMAVQEYGTAKPKAEKAYADMMAKLSGGGQGRK